MTAEYRSLCSEEVPFTPTATSSSITRKCNRGSWFFSILQNMKDCPHWMNKKTNFFTSNVVTDLNFKNHVNIHIKMGQSLPVSYICEDMPKCATCSQFKQMEE
jgi:hypothetical protein